MTIIHLTDAQRDTFAACGLIVIDGEVFVSTAERDMIGPRTPGTYTLVPEGWRILTEPCDTCGGHGKAFQPTRDGGAVRVPCWNPDCVGGRRVVTLTADCPMTTERGAPQGSCPHELGRFTIPALLPVVLHDGSEPDDFRLPCVCVHEQGVFLHVDYEAAEKLPLDPSPRPGQFIPRLERVE